MASSSNALQPVLKLQTPMQMGNQEYIPNPNTAEERAIYASQVIIPFELSVKTYAFMGPLPGENSSPNKFFPAYYKTRPLVSKIKIDDEAAITGLRPTGETFDPNVLDVDTINFNEATVTYTAFIQQYHDQANAAVSDVEHIAFLSSKPPMPSKRKVLPTTTPDVASDEEDKSPPRTRQGHKKRQKVTTPVGKGKGPGSSNITSSSDKVSSEESPLKATSNALVMESHNSSPATNTAKDDIGTATSDFNSFNAAIDLGNLQDVPQHTSHILSPVLEDAPPLATINTVSSVEGSHSTDDSPPTLKDANMGEEDQFSGEDNAAVPSTRGEDTVSDQGVVEETSKLIETDLCGNSNFETVVIPETTPMPAPAIPTPSELEQLRQTDSLSFLKTMMNIDSTSALASEASPTVQTKSGDKEDTPGLLHQIKENFFETNLVEILSKDSTRCHGLKQLLKKVDLLLVSKEVSDVIVLLGSLIDQL
ncbi:serine/threonine-rich protein adg2-like [Vicia villosa]|uniref:serine/threonine-rich protein adg2-like n=1 Tax=Vicia villosa TaxID=3911 RepID=UPI00273C87DA|nr:serine/threonine-rich protein adg2-like [Vicia villosa]